MQDNADLFVGAKLVQSSFALHNLTRDARAPVLSAIARSGATFLLVEFDCAGADLSLEQRTSDRTLQHYFDAYVAGVAEYGDVDDGSGLTDDEKGLAVDNFLMPVLFGSFARDASNMHEQSAGAWLDELRAAGFTRVTTRTLAEYWWAPCVMFVCERVSTTRSAW